MRSPVEQIKEKIGIVEVVQNYVKLERAGANLKGKCPFHNEKTPSFFVSPSRNTYFCFGCNAKGDIFSFVQEFDKVDFKGALKILAERAGVTLSDFNPTLAKEEDLLFEILENTTNYFQKNLQENKKSLEYLKERGLNSETIKEWRIGFAPSGWSNLLEHLKSKKYKEGDIEKAGLIKKKVDSLTKNQEVSRDFYDRFRERIIFPIFDSSGRVIGFSGRLWEALGVELPNTEGSSTPKAPKYLNSPDTPLFNKSEVLYGYHKAKNVIRQKKFTLLVEGQMDLLMCHQAGLDQAVATSGTALTEGQLAIIKRFSSNLMIAYDGDKAGINASKRAFTLALTLGFDVKVAPLPIGLDPAEMIKKDSEEFKLLLRNSQHIIDFTLDGIMKKGLKDRVLLKEVKESVLPYVNATSSPVERAYFISRIAEKIHIPEDAVREELVLLSEAPTSPYTESGIGLRGTSLENSTPKLSKKEEIERKIVGKYLASDELGKTVMETTFQRLFEDTPSYTLPALLISFEGDKEALIFEGELGTEEMKDHFKELAISLKRELIKTQLDVATSDLKIAEKEKDSKRVAELLKVCNELTKELSYLKM